MTPDQPGSKPTAPPNTPARQHRRAYEQPRGRVTESEIPRLLAPEQWVVIGGRLRIPQEHWQRLALALELTPRERQIAEMVVNDLTESAMARKLGIAPATVHGHLARLRKKLGVDTRCAVAVRILVEHFSLVGPAAELQPRCPMGDAARCPLRDLKLPRSE